MRIMEPTTLSPLLYCPRCHRSTEAVEGSELACPRCGKPRHFLKFGDLPTPLLGNRDFLRPRQLETAIQDARLRLPR